MGTMNRGRGSDLLTEAEAILQETDAAVPSADRSNHYKTLCISMYVQDVEELDAKVAELKRRGWTKANKSHLIRLALRQLDLDALPFPRVKSTKEVAMDPKIAAANQYQTYRRGWMAGAATKMMDSAISDHPDETIRAAYEKGYVDGQASHSKALLAAAKQYGYQPSILRLQNSGSGEEGG